MIGLPGRQRSVVNFEVDKAIIHDNVILHILLHPEVRDRKIVSLSIVGAFRKGKSFLLDYMLRYLYATVSFSLKSIFSFIIFYIRNVQRKLKLWPRINFSHNLGHFLPVKDLRKNGQNEDFFFFILDIGLKLKIVPDS
jgi:hypothetical protein